MVINPAVLAGEFDMLDHAGLSYERLMVSEDAHVIMPYQINDDKLRNQSLENGGIGSTGRGIGPCYTDKIRRMGIMISDLFDVDELRKKISKAAENYPQQFPTGKISGDDLEKIIAELKPYSERIKPFVRNTNQEMKRFYREGKKILLEGAQGLLLSVDLGIYPYVTSSDCSLIGTIAGVGLPPEAVDLCLGVIKFPVMSKVGGGPFVTEFGGIAGEEYCKDKSRNKIEQLVHYGVPHQIVGDKVCYNHCDPKILGMIISNDPVVKSAGLRLAAGEFGATTGRLRRLGWFDAVAARYAVGINGLYLVITKVDPFPDLDEFQICNSYTLDGKEIEFSRKPKILRQIQPGYKTFPGYGDVRGIKLYEDLPDELKQPIKYIEEFTGGQVLMVSNGPGPEEMIVKKGRFVKEIRHRW